MSHSVKYWRHGPCFANLLEWNLVWCPLWYRWINDRPSHWTDQKFSAAVLHLRPLPPPRAPSPVLFLPLQSRQLRPPRLAGICAARRHLVGSPTARPPLPPAVAAPRWPSYLCNARHLPSPLLLLPPATPTPFWCNNHRPHQHFSPSPLSS